VQVEGKDRGGITSSRSLDRVVATSLVTCAWPHHFPGQPALRNRKRAAALSAAGAKG
jgi:hypothetical protein